MAFKMKGSPMQRNFGIGSSFKQGWEGYEEEDQIEKEEKENIDDTLDFGEAEKEEEDNPNPGQDPVSGEEKEKEKEKDE